MTFQIYVKCKLMPVSIVKIYRNKASKSTLYILSNFVFDMWEKLNKN